MGVLDWPYRRSRKKRGIDWLKIDAFIDSKLWGAWQSLNERWDWITAVFARFRLNGVKRLLTEVFAEALTLTAGGLAGLYALACQVKPSVTPEEFIDTAHRTGDPLKLTGSEAPDIPARAVNPVRLIEALGARLQPVTSR